MTEHSSKLSISCIIPMYNEEGNVGRIIRDADSIFSQLVSDWEIVVIESGSTDNTWANIEKTAKDNPRIRAFRQERKEGMGSALRLAYSKCSKDLICILEADSPFDMTYFKKALPILSENDCVIGFRVGHRDQGFRWSYYNMERKGAFLRLVYHRGYNFILRLIFGLVVRDVNFSFKIFKREHIQRLKLISNGWFIDAEVLLELKKMGILPIEMPIEYKDRVVGRSTVNIGTPFNMLREMIKYISVNRNKGATGER